MPDFLTSPNVRADAIQRGRMRGSDIAWPSGAYEEACGSYTYRISELVFGSLLASYILGFVGIGLTICAGASGFKTGNDLLHSYKLIQLIQCGLISVAFAYLTAGYYAIYHSSILTMPHLPTYRLKTDFGIALLQAVLFGLSMIRPDGFLFFIGISWLRVFARQRRVFRDLASQFTAHVDPIVSGKDDPKEKSERECRNRERFSKTINEINKVSALKKVLESWLPVSPIMWALAFATVFIGAILEGRHYVSELNTAFASYPLGTAWMQVVIYSGVTIAIGFATNRVLVARAEHALIKDDPENIQYAIDRAAQEVVNKLKLKE